MIRIYGQGNFSNSEFLLHDNVHNICAYMRVCNGMRVVRMSAGNSYLLRLSLSHSIDAKNSIIEWAMIRISKQKQYINL